jgi:hypothetical protein
MRLFSGFLALTHARPPVAPAADAPGLIAFALRRWEGEYRSRDIPGGVETTPVAGSIWTVRADGSELHQVVGPEHDANAPAFSPDGHQIAFVSFVGKYPQLLVVPAAGGAPRNSRGSSAPSISSPGSRAIEMNQRCSTNLPRHIPGDGKFAVYTPASLSYFC